MSFQPLPNPPTPVVVPEMVPRGTVKTVFNPAADNFAQSLNPFSLYLQDFRAWIYNANQIMYDNVEGVYDATVAAGQNVANVVAQAQVLVDAAEQQVEDAVASTLAQAQGFAGQADNSATEAAASAQLAQAAANFAGDWANQSGAASAPLTVYYNGQYWTLLQDVANISAYEPSDTSTIWAGVHVVDVVRTPVIIAPLSGTTGASPQPTLEADGYANIYSFSRDYREFQVDLSEGDFSSPLWSAQADEDTAVVGVTLAFNTGHKWRCRDVAVDGTAGRWSSVAVFSTGAVSIAKPTLTVEGAPDDVGETPLLETSAFSVIGSSDTHLNTDWQALDDQLKVIWESPADATNKLSIRVPSGILQEFSTCTFRARHRGVTYGVSSWGSISVTTTASFSGVVTPQIISPVFQLSDTGSIVCSQFASKGLLHHHESTKLEAYENGFLIWSEEIIETFDPAAFTGSDQMPALDAQSENIESSADEAPYMAYIAVGESATELSLPVDSEVLIGELQVKILETVGPFGFIAGFYGAAAPVVSDAFKDSLGITRTITSVSSVVETAAWRAFDKEPSTSWGFLGSTGEVTVTYDLDILPYLISYRIQSTSTDRAPKAWIIEGSFDGSSWVQLDSQVDVTSWTANEEKTFALQSVSGSGYQKYRLRILDNNGSEVTELAGIVFDTHTERSHLNELSFLADFTSGVLSNETTYDFRVGYKAAGDEDYTFSPLKPIRTPNQWVASGEAVFTTPGTYEWIAPADMEVSVVCVGGGGGGASGGSSASGGALAYKTQTVEKGTSYPVVVGTFGRGNYYSRDSHGDGRDGGLSSFNTTLIAGGGRKGRYSGASSETIKGGTSSGADGGGDGGNGAIGSPAGGGGAGGYSGNGGNAVPDSNGHTGNGGGGGAGASTPSHSVGGAGGGVGIFGQGPNGYGGQRSTGSSLEINNGGGGSSGENGQNSFGGGLFGGGGGTASGGATMGSSSNARSSRTDGGHGAVRIIWGVQPDRRLKAFPHNAQ